MSTQMQPALALGTVLTAAVLLSGDITQAEDAAADAILALDTDDFETDALLTCILMLSIQRSHSSPKGPSGQTSGISATLPAELQNILCLSSKFRHCFVLRVLLGLPKETCHQMLQIDDDEFKQAISSAAVQLAAISAAMWSTK
jgi:hypothetical protein